jgi:hypothetical protein
MDRVGGGTMNGNEAAGIIVLALCAILIAIALAAVWWLGLQVDGLLR